MKRRQFITLLGGAAAWPGGGTLNARVGSLARYEKNNRKAEPQAAFLKVEPRATQPDSCPLPVANPQLQAAPVSASFHLGFCTSQSQTWMRGRYQMPRYPSQTGAPRVQ